MRRLFRAPAAAALVFLVILMLGASPALAAVAPAAWESADVTLILDENPPVILVAGTLPANATLPADGQLSVPTGAQPQWLGEIMGGDPSQDPSLETSVTTQGSIDVYPFRFFRSRTAQLEALLPNAVTADGSNFSTSISWPSQQDAAQVRLSVRLPKSAKIVVPAEGATLVTEDPTANYYTRTFADVKAGTPVALSVTFSMPTDTGVVGDGSGNSALIPLLLAGLAVAVIALGIVIARSRRVAASTDDDDAEPGDDGDGGDDGAEPGDDDDDDDDDGDFAAADVAEAPEDEDEDEDEFFATDMSETDELPVEGTTPGRRFSPKTIMVFVVAGVMLIAGVAAAMNATAPKASAEGITKQFAQGEACTIATIPLELASDTESEAERVFTAVQPVPGIVYATVSADGSHADIGYCDSQATEPQIRAALTQGGFKLGAGAESGY